MPLPNVCISVLVSGSKSEDSDLLLALIMISKRCRPLCQFFKGFQSSCDDLIC